MNLIQGQSINSKLTMLTAVSSGIALLLSTVAFFVNDWSSIRQSKIRQLSALGGVIASNSTATLAFDQPMAAEELLASLGSRPTVHFACLYDSDGNLFAEFRRDADAQFDPPPRPQHGSNFTKTGFLDIAMPVLEEDGTELGTLYMHTAMTDLKNQLYTHASIAASVLIASLVVAVLLASRLQRFISGPILQLAGAAKQISSEGNYSIRVEKTSDDEIGDLYDQFNGMLDRIQMADEEIHQTHTQLQAANNELEERVQKRTEQLSIANDQLKNEIEERARVHNELKQSEKRVRAIVDSAFDAIITVDERGAIESFNPAAEKMFGYKASEVLGAEVNVLMANQYADRGNFVKHYAETGETQIMGGQVEFEGRRQDGSEFALELFVSEFRLFDRRVFTGFIRDLTAANEAAEKLQDMNERLVDISRQAGMAEVANGVLHNVGNVLNSVNVSASLISETVRNSEVNDLGRVLGIVEQNLPNLSTFIADDPRGKHLPNYLIEAGKVLNQERETVMEKVASLTKKIDHIKDIVATQQSYAGSSGMAQPVSVAELMEDAVQINSASLERHQIVVERNYSELPEVTLDKQKLLQILINLVANAKQAVQENTSVHGHIELIVKRDDDDFQLEVVDNGVGILQENLDRIFRHGFTTKQGGHGFGLHSAALAAKEMGGSLTVESEGRGSGARFKLRLPLRTEAAAVA